MIKNLNKVFEELLNRYVSSIESNYKKLYKKAKDKEFVMEEQKKELTLLLIGKPYPLKKAN